MRGPRHPRSARSSGVGNRGLRFFSSPATSSVPLKVSGEGLKGRARTGLTRIQAVEVETGARETRLDPRYHHP